MPETFLEGLEKDESSGKYKVTLQYPHLYPIIKMCKIPETRKILTTANSSKAKEPNTKLLEDMLELRDKEAHLLGYKNHAAYMQVIHYLIVVIT
jgi:Zn-dependent oligopeptidase